MMRTKSLTLSAIFFILFCFSVVQGVNADLPLPGDKAAAQVMVTRVVVYPEEFFPYDTGTVSVTVTNTGDTAVAVRRATMYDNNFIIEQSNYDSVGLLGAGNSMTFTFTVRARSEPGIYYPVFSMDFRDAGFLRYPVKILVKDTPLSVSVLSRPDSFTEGKKDTIGLRIGNPRDNRVESVMVQPVGTGFDSIPSGIFLGPLEPNNATSALFTITPYSGSNVTFTVSYKNGINDHSTTAELPLKMGSSKTSPNPVVSNIAVTDEGEYFRVTGDVTNAGLEDAKAVIITTDSPAAPVDPFRINVVGSLKPDDFSSFEVTFKVENASSVPMVVDYKDTDGNPYKNRMDVGLPSHTGEKKAPGEFPVLPAVIGILVGILVVFVVFISWRNRKST